MGKPIFPIGHKFDVRIPGLGRGLPHRPRSLFVTSSTATPYGTTIREEPHSDLFLYLGRREWADTWVSGGVVPIFPASTYLSPIREATQTPDEVKQYKWSGAPEEVLGRYIGIGNGARNVRMRDIFVNDKRMPDTVASHYSEDALVLCFSTERSFEVQRKLKKSCCVRIADFDKLISAIERSLATLVLFGKVKYTQTSERSHFVKSEEDGWMAEYRIVSPGSSVKETAITLPAGIAVLEDLEEIVGRASRSDPSHPALPGSSNNSPTDKRA